MGEIIAMTGPKRSIRRSAFDGGAEILFFTGVRYIRVAEPAPALAVVTPHRAARKSRRMSAADGAKSA